MGTVYTGGVTQTITITLVFSPLTVVDLEASQSYTATLDTGNVFELRRTASYGEILIGVSALLLSFMLLFGGRPRERNAPRPMDIDPGEPRRFERSLSGSPHRQKRGSDRE